MVGVKEALSTRGLEPWRGQESSAYLLLKGLTSAEATQKARRLRLLQLIAVRKNTTGKGGIIRRKPSPKACRSVYTLTTLSHC